MKTPLIAYAGRGARPKVQLVFENLGEEDWGYGVKTIILGLNGKSTGYKAVFNKGKFVAIVGIKYRVLPNEQAVEIIEPILKEHDFKIKWKDDDGVRLFIRAERSDGYGVVFRNAIDGSSAFRIYVTVPGKYFNAARILVAKIYAKHYDRSLENTIKAVKHFFSEEYMRLVKVIEETLEELERAEVTKEYLELLEDKLPRKYLHGARYVAKKYGNPRAVLEYVAKNIWYARVDDDYKITLFRTLLELTAAAFEFFRL